MAVRPLFLLGLPRSGSTLVQRVLAAHRQIATAPEPWVLLPLVYARRASGARAEYGHRAAVQGIGHFSGELRGGPSQFDAAIRGFVESLYDSASPPDASYFLDKTPRYHHVVGDILRIFPDAKVVFLWRNPLSVVASMLETFRAGDFRPYDFAGDLYEGLPRLVDAYERVAGWTRAVRYEDLVGDRGEDHWRELFAFLELEFDPGVLTDFAKVELRAEFGDPVGSRRYRQLSSEPLEKWRQTLRGPARVAWSLRFLSRIGTHRLELMGYDRRALSQQLASGAGGAGRMPVDAAHLLRSWARSRIAARLLELPETLPPRGPTYPPRRG